MSDAPYERNAVGERVRLLRESLGLTPTEFASKANLPRPGVSNWESGRQRPGFKDAKSICDVYGVTLDWLFLGRIEGLRYEVASRLVEAQNKG